MVLVVIRHLRIGDVHVLASINVEVFSLFVSDFESILMSNFLVLSEISTDDWAVGVSPVGADQVLEGVSHSQPLNKSPPEGRRAAVLDLFGKLFSHPATNEPTDSIDSELRVIQVCESVSIYLRDVVAANSFLHTFAISEDEKVVESIIFYPGFSEPWSS